MILRYWCQVVISMLIMATSVAVHQEGFVITSMLIAILAVVVFIKALRQLKFTKG